MGSSRRQSPGALFLPGCISFCHAGTRTARCYLFRYTNASYLPSFLFHHDFYHDERRVQLGGQHAWLGTSPGRDFSPQPFHKNNADGSTKRQRFQRYCISPGSHGGYRAISKQLGGIELQKNLRINIRSSRSKRSEMKFYTFDFCRLK